MRVCGPSGIDGDSMVLGQSMRLGQALKGSVASEDARSVRTTVPTLWPEGQLVNCLAVA